MIVTLTFPLNRRLTQKSDLATIAIIYIHLPRTKYINILQYKLYIIYNIIKIKCVCNITNSTATNNGLADTKDSNKFLLLHLKIYLHRQNIFLNAHNITCCVD